MRKPTQICQFSLPLQLPERQQKVLRYLQKIGLLLPSLYPLLTISGRYYRATGNIQIRNVGRMMKSKFFTVAYGFALGAAMLSGAGIAASEARGQSTAPEKSPVNLSSEVKIERTQLDASGKETATLHEPKDVVVVPGDRVVFTLNVVNSGAAAASGFRATNPIPAAVAFVAVTEDWAEVSVDGGTSWGKLTAMTVKEKSAETGLETTRAATAADVTHVRWIFSNAIAAGAKTAVSYRGVVK